LGFGICMLVPRWSSFRVYCLVSWYLILDSRMLFFGICFFGIWNLGFGICLLVSRSSMLVSSCVLILFLVYHCRMFTERLPKVYRRSTESQLCFLHQWYNIEASLVRVWYEFDTNLTGDSLRCMLPENGKNRLSVNWGSATCTIQRYDF
jgi:hypothetical protein